MAKRRHHLAMELAGMKARLNYGWRLVATGMSFVVFGVCGLLFSVLVFPLAWMWPHRASRQTHPFSPVRSRKP